MSLSSLASQFTSTNNSATGGSIWDTAPPPPTGPNHNYPSLLFSWWCTACAVTIIAFRLIGRKVRSNVLFREDWIMMTAVIPLLIRQGLIHVVLLYRTNNVQTAGFHFSAQDIAHRTTGSQLVIAARLFFALFIWISKLTVSEFLKRITVASSWRSSYEYTLRGIRIFLFVSFGCVVIATLTECMPFDHFWQVIPDPGPQCRTGYANLISMGVCDIVTDILLVAFPIPIVLRSGQTWQRKLQLTSLFSLSLIMIAVTATRVPEVIFHRGRQQYRTVWASCEILASAAVSNAVILGSFLRDKGTKKNKYRSHSFEDSVERGSIKKRAAVIAAANGHVANKNYNSNRLGSSAGGAVGAGAVGGAGGAALHRSNSIESMFRSLGMRIPEHLQEKVEVSPRPAPQAIPPPPGGLGGGGGSRGRRQQPRDLSVSLSLPDATTAADRKQHHHQRSTGESSDSDDSSLRKPNNLAPSATDLSTPSPPPPPRPPPIIVPSPVQSTKRAMSFFDVGGLLLDDENDPHHHHHPLPSPADDHLGGGGGGLARHSRDTTLVGSSHSHRTLAYDFAASMTAPSPSSVTTMRPLLTPPSPTTLTGNTGAGAGSARGLSGSRAFLHDIGGLFHAGHYTQQQQHQQQRQLPPPGSSASSASSDGDEQGPRDNSAAEANNTRRSAAAAAAAREVPTLQIPTNREEHHHHSHAFYHAHGHPIHLPTPGTAAAAAATAVGQPPPPTGVLGPLILERQNTQLSLQDAGGLLSCEDSSMDGGNDAVRAQADRPDAVRESSAATREGQRRTEDRRAGLRSWLDGPAEGEEVEMVEYFRQSGRALSGDDYDEGGGHGYDGVD